MRTLYLMCGLAFSGKSTLAREIEKALGAAYISLDDINRGRGLGHSGDGISIAEWEQTHRVAAERFHALCERCTHVVIDDTNCFRWLRDRWTALATQVGYSVRIVYLDTPVSVVAARRAQNEQTQTRHGIRKPIFEEHLRTFERPAGDENALVFMASDEASSWIASHLRR